MHYAVIWREASGLPNGCTRRRKRDALAVVRELKRRPQSCGGPVASGVELVACDCAMSTREGLAGSFCATVARPRWWTG